METQNFCNLNWEEDTNSFVCDTLQSLIIISNRRMRETNRLRRDWNLERAHRLQFSGKACVHGRNIYELVIRTVIVCNDTMSGATTMSEMFMNQTES